MDPVIFGICLVDFHHKRGPEVEYWYGLPEEVEKDQLWADLPFQALPDGSHSFEETFTYFTLLYNKKTHSSHPNDVTQIPEEEMDDYTTLFAISCSQQIKSDELLIKDESVTRSTVQKAIVVISYQPILGQIKDKLSIVTNVFFMQHDFTDKTILDTLYDSLVSIYDPCTYAELSQTNDNSNVYMGISLQNILIAFKKDILVLFKALLLEKKIIVYGTHVENICNLQFGLISLIPDLIFHLDDSISPQLYDKEILEANHTVDSFKSSDKKSVYKFLGLPLRIFEKGGLFSPYTPLQQIHNIKSDKTQFFMIGTSNSLLYEQRDQLCDIFVNLNQNSVEIINKDLNPLLNLSHHDKKWIDSMLNLVDTPEISENVSTENLADDSSQHRKISNISYEGSDDFLRTQFEEYLFGLLSSVKLYEFINLHEDNEMAMDSVTEEMIKNKPINTFNFKWVEAWLITQNYKIFNKITDDRIFDLFPPRHVYNGVDPFTLFQQKFLNTFQNLKKNTSTLSKESVVSDKSQNRDNINDVSSPTDKSETSSVKGVPSENDSTPPPPQINEIWNNWKQYFKKDNNNNNSNIKRDELVTSDEKQSVISDDNNLKKHSTNNSLKKQPSNNSNHSKNAKNVFENALMGLGIHIEKKNGGDSSRNKDEGLDKNVTESTTTSVTKSKSNSTAEASDGDLF